MDREREKEATTIEPQDSKFIGLMMKRQRILFSIGTRETSPGGRRDIMIEDTILRRIARSLYFYKFKALLLLFLFSLSLRVLHILGVYFTING